MKIIITEEQLHLLLNEDYETEVKLYKDILNYRGKIIKKIEEIFNLSQELKYIFHPQWRENSIFIDGKEAMDYYVDAYKKDTKNSYFKCKSSSSKKNIIIPANFIKDGKFNFGTKNYDKVPMTSQDNQKALSIYNSIQTKIKELNSIKPPSGYKIVGCIDGYTTDSMKINNKTEKELYSIGFVYPLVPIPSKPKKPKLPTVVTPKKTPVIEPKSILQVPTPSKTIPTIKSEPIKTTEFTAGYSDSPVYGPSLSLIGFMRGRDFIPATGKYVIGMNKADKDLLNNKVELNKYIQIKFGQYANPIQ